MLLRRASIFSSSFLIFSAFFISFRLSLYLQNVFRQLTRSSSLISKPRGELLVTERWSQTLLYAKIEGDVGFLSKRSALVLKPPSICACPWLRVKTKIITFQSDVYFSFRKNHRPKNLSKRLLTISYLKNASALFFPSESTNDSNWSFDWSASSAFICLHSYKHVTSFPNLETDMFFFWIIFKGIRQAAFLTKLKFSGDFSLSFFKIAILQ